MSQSSNSAHDPNAAPSPIETGGTGPGELDWNALYTRDFVLTRGGEEDADYWNGRARTFGSHPDPAPLTSAAPAVAAAAPADSAASTAPEPATASADSAEPAESTAPAEPADQDARATARPGSYAAMFLDLAGLLPGESIIDMGCGTGALAIPAAGQGHSIVACDLAQAMLDRLRVRAQAAGVADRIDVRQMSWLDSWDDLPVADVFFSSRSLFTRDLRATLEKMEAHTRRRCCVTVATADSPQNDRTMLAAIGRPYPRHAEHVYLFNLLYQMGRLPRVSYIEHVKPVVGSTRQQVIDDFVRRASPMTADEESALGRFVDKHFDFSVRDAFGLPKRDYDQPIRWAFVSWDVPARD